jgi:hypothetical protein
VRRKIQRFFNGYQECRGLYSIVDATGTYLDEVAVYCQVGEHSEWALCDGEVHRCGTLTESSCLPNFRQTESLLYRQGQPVRWRFEKKGYLPCEITRYTADVREKTPVRVELVPLETKAV